MGNSVQHATSFSHLILLTLLWVGTASASASASAPTLAQDQDQDRSGSVQAHSTEQARPSEPALPELSELEDGWNTLHPGGETTCAHGDDFRFFARAADPERLVVYLNGGGGCWDAETCDPERESAVYSSTVEPRRHPAQLSGILDMDRPDNPLAGYAIVSVPVCTGDAFLGDRDATYKLKTESGDSRVFTIHHRGQTNTMAVMDWIKRNFESPREIFVAGSSAGGLGTPFYASLLARYYPSARVVALGDDAGSWGVAGTGEADAREWGIPDVLRRHPGWEEFDESLRVEHLYTTAARSMPNLRLYQFNHAHDEVQRFYLKLAGAEDLDVLRHLRVNQNSIHERVPEFRAFTAGGFRHTVLPDEGFYQYQTDGHRLRDWVGAVVEGEAVPSVDCGDGCLRPGLVYGEKDLRIVERALELLSAPDAWNPQDAPGECPGQANRYSLRCATVQAVRDVTGQPPGRRSNQPPAARDVIYTVTDRLGHRGTGDVIRWYNNREDATAADMIAVLEEVRQRVRTSLAANQ